MEELCYILQECLRQAKKSKLESLSPKNSKDLVPHLMLEIQVLLEFIEGNNVVLMMCIII
jgi:hypothetical protein